MALEGAGLLEAEAIDAAPILEGTDIALTEGDGGTAIALSSLNPSSPAPIEDDLFVFNSPNEGVDLIADFSKSEDTLVFSSAGFGGDLIPGVVSSEMFALGSAATTEAHRFIYDGSNGDLFYDSDGIGEDERVKLARLSEDLDLDSDHLFIDIV